MNNYIFNEEYKQIAEYDNDLILIKNMYSNRVVKLSSTEFEIIKEYGKNNSFSWVIEKFSDEFTLENDLLTKIIDYAKNLNILKEINSEENIGKQKHEHDYILRPIYYFFTLLRLNKLGLVLDFKGNFNLIKLFNWKIKSSSFSRTTYIGLIYFFAIFLSLYTFFSVENIDFNFILFNIGNTSIYKIVLIGLPLGLIASFLHEFAHFSMYRLFGGKQNEMGLALMYRIIPVFYTCTEDMILWKNKYKKALVGLSGFISDLFFMCIFILIQQNLSLGILNSLISFLIFSLFIKTIYNLNPFSPGSDAYFMINDLLNFESPFTKAHMEIKKILKFNWREKINVLSILYGFICYINISIYLLLFASLLTLPIWIKYVF